MKNKRSIKIGRCRAARPRGIGRRIRKFGFNRIKLVVAALAVMLVIPECVPTSGFSANDPGVQNAEWDPGDPLPGLTDAELAFFKDARDDFEESEGIEDGLGPRFNMDSCGGCHAHPGVGGSSPSVNPQVAVATDFGALNHVPSFITSDGPVREVRYKYSPDGARDGGVHDLFVISGRVDGTGDASGCHITQEDFASQDRKNNMIFRIPTPVFGGGLIEQIPDNVILANQAAAQSQKVNLGIHGHPHRVRIDNGTTNVNGNDGTIARFGWKAQNKSLILFAGEAYNVEMGISNELFQTEREEAGNCQFAPTPNNVTNIEGMTPAEILSGIEKFAFFMRVLAPPTPSLTTPGGADSIANGRAVFQNIGCAYCHTPTLRTGNTANPVLANKDVNLYSDLLLHNMGPGLADDVVQAQAGPDEFRTAPLWGLGQRIFLLHDGRTKNLVDAILAHNSAGNTHYKPSEANHVVSNFNDLSDTQKQDLLNFLRSL